MNGRSFLSSRFPASPKELELLRTKEKILRTKRAFNMKQKVYFIETNQTNFFGR